jgi:SLOG cluster2
MITPPSQTIASTLPLEGLRVGISGAVPERQYWGQIPDLDRLILTFVAQLSALVIRYGGEVVHGSQPLFTPVVAEQARRQSHEGIRPLKLFASQLFGELPEVTRRAASMAHAQVVLTRQVGKGDYRDRETRNNSLTAMRLAMTQEIDTLVAVGGKLHLDTGFNPGVLEELAHARWHGTPCFIVGAFSGAAAQLDHPILEELSSGNLLGTGPVPMADMARLTDTMDEYVGKLLAHLARHQQQFRQPKQIEFSQSALNFSIESDDTSSDGARVVNVDPMVVNAWSAHFADLMRAVQQKDTGQARKLLNGTDLPKAGLESL